jgi:hypothetical protein
MGLAVRMEYPVEAALRADIQPLIGKGWHDLPGGKRRELRVVAGERDPSTFFFAQLVRDQAWTAFTAIVTVPISCQGLPTAFEGAHADADLAAGAQQTCTSGMGLTDHLDGLAPVNSDGQPSASSEQKASHFFHSTNNAAISAMAFSLRCSSFLRALISRWSWARSFSSARCQLRRRVASIT